MFHGDSTVLFKTTPFYIPLGCTALPCIYKYVLLICVRAHLHLHIKQHITYIHACDHIHAWAIHKSSFFRYVCFFPTCRVRVARFYFGVPSPPPLLLRLLLLFRLLRLLLVLQCVQLRVVLVEYKSSIARSWSGAGCSAPDPKDREGKIFTKCILWTPIFFFGEKIFFAKNILWIRFFCEWKNSVIF